MFEEIGGHRYLGDRDGNAPMRQGAIPPAAIDLEVEGHSSEDHLQKNAPNGVRANDDVDAVSPLPAANPIKTLSELQRQRRFCIKSQSRTDRACEAFIAHYLGYRPDLPKPEGLAIWKQAAALRRAVEKGGQGHARRGDQIALALSTCSTIILHSASSRVAWDKHRKQTEKEMRKLAIGLPPFPWVKSVSGFGDLGLAIIIGETGDLSNYATKERVWKRLGLAVISGERQQRKAGTEAAAAHGYNPARRAEVWTIADSMFRHQWRGAKDDHPAEPAGPYGVVYARRKAHTVNRDGWTLAHRENDARRVMTKALVEDLWRVWRGLSPLCGMPP